MSSKFNSLFLCMACVLFMMAGQSPSAAARRFIGVNTWCRRHPQAPMFSEGEGRLHLARCLSQRHESDSRASQVNPVHAQPHQAAISFLEPQSRESILASCAEYYDLAISDLEDSIKALEVNDTGTLKVHLSAAYSTDCSDALAEFGVEDPLAKVSDHYLKMVDNCLAVVQQI